MGGGKEGWGKKRKKEGKKMLTPQLSPMSSAWHPYIP